MGVIVLIALLLLGFQNVEADEVVENKIERCLFEFNKILSSGDQNILKVQYLVKIDKEIRDLLKQYNKKLPVKWKVEYSQLGLSLNHWDFLVYEYNGKLLDKAYELDSKNLREFMLFAEMHTGWYCWVNNKENLMAGLKYVKKYPDGPYITDVYYNLGGFYWSLFNDLSEIIENNTAKGELTERYIFSPYIIEDKNPLQKQKEEAQEKVIKYWGIYLKKASYNLRWVSDMLQIIREDSGGGYGTFSCPD